MSGSGDGLPPTDGVVHTLPCTGPGCVSWVAMWLPQKITQDHLSRELICGFCAAQKAKELDTWKEKENEYAPIINELKRKLEDEERGKGRMMEELQALKDELNELKVQLKSVEILRLEEKKKTFEEIDALKSTLNEYKGKFDLGEQLTHTLQGFMLELKENKDEAERNKMEEELKALRDTLKGEILRMEERENVKDLEQQVRGNLNNLTRQKFDTLVSKFNALKIETPQTLEKLVDLVFSKAVDEPKFAETCAKLCVKVQEKKISITDCNGKKVQYKFKKLLLNRCQEEFERIRFDTDYYTMMIYAAETEEEKKELHAKMEDAKRDDSSEGVIFFIGQLFKVGMLTMPIMYQCMEKLLEHWRTTLEEDYIECLCRLLTIIGYRLEFYFEASKDDPLRQPLHKTIPPNLRQKNLQKLGPVLQQMKNLSDEEWLSSRIRFCLEDVIELQQNGWVPRARQNTNAPKTIDEIHKEAEMEEHRLTNTGNCDEAV
ncbi:unnamed protein product [Cyprideis torosa]|uniref:Uncharacterized protein n=1 Tax=Cyprideis torosa TaxID=163714 RepID=A0A7R8W2X0_9CRUS|nr:unnamed protein product [Cyprideis torosa]CAG0882403.1 unnamed protein product [Cyprideis torosa]